MTKFSEIELFKDLTMLGKDDNKTYDLHNEYNCFAITYDSNFNALLIAFDPVNKNLLEAKICLSFEEVSIVKFELTLPNSKDSVTINSFYRGRFEKNGELFEYSAKNQGYFYVEFENGSKFEFFSRGFQLSDI
jgi:hypothetical protein